MPFFKEAYPPARRPPSEEETLAYSLGLMHAHCEGCFSRYCSITPDGLSSCEMVNCKLGCGQRYHQCKQTEHNQVCSEEKVSCVNSLIGCPMMMKRSKVASHLSVCPASVVRCVIEWNRWPMYSAEECIKAPLPLTDPHVKCAQLDVALALRDQRVLMESMKTPRRIRKIFQNSLTTKYPSVPLESCRSRSYEDCPSDDTSHNVSDDDSDAPWEASKYPPGLQRSVYSKLYKASKETSETLNHTLDYVSTHIGMSGLLKKIKETDEIKNGDSENLDQENDNDQKTFDVEDEVNIDKSEIHVDDDNASMPDVFEDIYKKKIKLHELLGVNLTIECISKYQPKPTKMFTFLCAQNFRRDEYAWHFKNVHNDIHCGLNGMLEQRCPLAYLGCDFTFSRLYPKLPQGKIIHSTLLESFGLLTDCKDEESGIEISPSQSFSQEDKSKESEVSVQLEDVAKRKLREATPEVITSCRFDSDIKVFPRYRKSSGHNSSQSLSNLDSSECLLLSSLPVEVLQHIAKYLDSFSLNNLSLTCRALRSVCCMLLEQKGMVVMEWERQKSGSLISWKVVKHKWSFSTSFTPVKTWGYDNPSVLSEHLKVCPYNQPENKNIRTEKYEILPEKLELPFVKCKGWRNDFVLISIINIDDGVDSPFVSC